MLFDKELIKINVVGRVVSDTYQARKDGLMGAFITVERDVADAYLLAFWRGEKRPRGCEEWFETEAALRAFWADHDFVVDWDDRLGHVHPFVIDAILCGGMDLASLGVANWALDREAALAALDKLAAHQVSVLGGDVLVVNGDKVTYNYDNWYCNPRPSEPPADFALRSISAAKGYIRTYDARGQSVLFTLCPDGASYAEKPPENWIVDGFQQLKTAYTGEGVAYDVTQWVGPQGDGALVDIDTPEMMARLTVWDDDGGYAADAFDLKTDENILCYFGKVLRGEYFPKVFQDFFRVIGLHPFNNGGAFRALKGNVVAKVGSGVETCWFTFTNGETLSVSNYYSLTPDDTDMVGAVVAEVEVKDFCFRMIFQRNGTTIASLRVDVSDTGYRGPEAMVYRKSASESIAWKLTEA